MQGRNIHDNIIHKVHISALQSRLLERGVRYGAAGSELFFSHCQREKHYEGGSVLHVTQPTLSRQIAQLEDELGVKLLNRSSHNITLTEEGMILKRRAQEILSLADKTKRDFLYREENLAGEISIGSGEFLSSRILAERMPLSA